MSTCTYCRKIGHSKHFCPVLQEKIEQKKAVRNDKKQIQRFKGIVKRFGATEAALDRLYLEALSVVKHFRTLEEGAESLSGDLFEKRCDELASLEEDYEEKCAFLDFLENSEITFMKKKKEEEKTIEKSLFEVLSTGVDESYICSVPDTPEESIMNAEDHYWRKQYRKGRNVFFGWLEAVSEQKSKLKEHFPSGGWKNTTPKEVFNIGASLADKPKVGKMRLGGFKKKKSQRQKRAEC